MPIFRINDQLHYFAHVPKCGGTSVEHYLVDRFGPIALHESGRVQKPDEHLWTRSHTQHVPVTELFRMIPQGWFASSFAVVRHPVSRLISGFFQRRDVGGRLPLGTDFNAWFHGIVREFDGLGFQHNNLRPQSDLVPADATIFRFEDGLDQIIPHIDALAGTSDGPRAMPRVNLGCWRNDEAPPTVTPETLELVVRFYAADFKRFRYPVPATAAETAALTALPKSTALGAAPVPQPRKLVQRLQRSLMKRAGL